MESKELVEFLKNEIYRVEKSKKEAELNPDMKIVTVHLASELFLKLAYTYVGIKIT